MNEASGQRREPILLCVNIDHVATLRQARYTRYPDPVEAALAAERGGGRWHYPAFAGRSSPYSAAGCRTDSPGDSDSPHLEMAVTDDMLLMQKKFVRHIAVWCQKNVKNSPQKGVERDCAEIPDPICLYPPC